MEYLLFAFWFLIGLLVSDALARGLSGLKRLTRTLRNRLKEVTHGSA